MRYLMILCCFFMLPRPLYADILHQLFQATLQNNLQLKQSRVLLQQKQNQLESFDKQQDWQLFAQSAFSEQHYYTYKNGYLSSQTDKTLVMDNALGVQKTFANGIKLTPLIKYVQGQDPQQSYAQGKLPNGLFLGAEIPLLKNPAEIERIKKQIAQKQFQIKKIDALAQSKKILLQLSRYYWQWLMLVQQKQYRQQQLNDINRRLKRLQEQVKAGEKPPSALQKIQAEKILAEVRLQQLQQKQQQSRQQIQQLGNQTVKLSVEQGAVRTLANLSEQDLLKQVIAQDLHLQQLALKKQIVFLKQSINNQDNKAKLDISLDSERLAIRYQQVLGERRQKVNQDGIQLLLDEIKIQQQQRYQQDKDKLQNLLATIKQAASSWQQLQNTVELFARLQAQQQQAWLSGQGSLSQLLDIEKQLLEVKLQQSQVQKSYYQAKMELQFLSQSLEQIMAQKNIIGASYAR